MTDQTQKLTPELILQTRAGRAVLWIALFALLCQLWPEALGGARLRWLPDDPRTLVPRFLRFEHDALPWATADGAALAGLAPVDDQAVLDLAASPASPGSGPAETPPRPAVGAPASAPGSAPADTSPIPLKGTYTEDTPLPPPPEPREAGSLTVMPIEDPHGVMARFYASLARTAAGQGQTRVVHYGDSLITGDYITQTLRRLLQKKFGDAGHGFVLGGLTSPWYRRNNLELRASDDWHVNRITRPQLGDGAYGLGAVSFRTEKAGESVDYFPKVAKDEGGLNQSIARVQVWAWGGPRAGSFEVKSDGAVLGRVEARLPAPGPVVGTFTVPDAFHRIRVATTGGGEARLFGVALERDTPGVIYDSLGVDGTRAKILRFFNEAHWYDQLRRRAPDLLVLHYGTNEGEAAELGTKNYREDLLPVVRGLREALPHIPCLLIGPMDRADTDEKGELVSRPVVRRITEVQRRVAYMTGCAFYDTYRAMGGDGSMAKWYRNRLGGGDMTHPTRQGADRLGAMIFTSLMEGYRKASAR